ncbi:MAG: MFS transporter [Patescibacteria group bacterium]|nr:MFS transporter [Patescibacteria group bacterium]
MLLNFHIPHYFTRQVREEIGELYAASAISNLALSVVMLFEPIFLYSVLHFSVPKVLAFMAVVYLVYIFAIPMGGWFASVYGYRHSIAISIPFQVLYWLLLVYSSSYPHLAFVAAAMFGLQKTFYWPGFHSVIARYAEAEQMGREFGVVYSIINMVNTLGPLLGGLLAQRYGLYASFVLASVAYCCSAIPLFSTKEIFTPKVYHFRDTWQLYKDYPKKFMGYLGFGEELLLLTVWPIFIYIVVKDYSGTGLLATSASIVAAGLSLVLGKVADVYTKRVLIKIGAFFSSLVWLARLVITNVWNTFAIDTLSRASKEVSFIPISAVTYLRAEATHVIPYAVFFEQSLAVGKLSACLLGILLFSLTGSFMVLFILAAGYSLLYMYI